MTTPKLIAFSGYARSGKDSAAAALVADGWERRAFADKLKEFLYALNPQIVQAGITYRLAPLVDFYGWETVKEDYPEARELLQRLGTEAGRRLLGENVWVDAALAGLDGPVAISDCRFHNEADAVRALGGIVVRVTRPGVGPKNDHDSETSMDDYPWDVELTNDGTLADLAAKVRTLTAT